MAQRITETAGNPGMSRVVPQFATTQKGATMPYCDSSPPFVYVYNPLRWTVVAGKLIPALHKTPLESGVNRVLTGSDGRVHFADARAKIETQGRTLIPYEWGPGGSYLQVIECRPEGKGNVAKAHLSVWEEASVGDTRVHGDIEAYASWVASLVDEGKLPACPPHLAERLLDARLRQSREAEAKAEKGGPGSGEAGLRAEALEQEVVVLRAAAERQGAPVRGKSTQLELGA